MKRLITLLFFLIFTASCHTELKKPDYKFMSAVKNLASLDSSLTTRIVLIPKNFDYGLVKDSELVRGSFYIKNTGKNDFRIVAIKSNCICIKTAYTKTSIIHAGDSLKINYEKAIYGASRSFSNTIIVMGNCQFGNQTYYFRGNIY